MSLRCHHRLLSSQAFPCRRETAKMDSVGKCYAWNAKTTSVRSHTVQQTLNTDRWTMCDTYTSITKIKGSFKRRALCT